ncbi:hypothetical protein DFH07DRAFT_776352 [Mycena maculata]|uniref:Uncharacterized protein n=1 Tax=Mycena maculata TaxID=230809 RepID=A0AAD7N5I9_9AGAR|nr:hypothetical protein DFH07DRAFT_776352 [Mycena maculata]
MLSSKALPHERAMPLASPPSDPNPPLTHRPPVPHLWRYPKHALSVIDFGHQGHNSMAKSYPQMCAGITLHPFHFDSDGLCKSQLSCPVVIHNDANEFQFNYLFYYKPWGDIDPPRSVVGVTWSLGAHGCHPDTLCNTLWVSTFDRNVQNQTEGVYSLWVIRVAGNLDVKM